MFIGKNRIEQAKKFVHPSEVEFTLKLLYYLYKVKNKKLNECVNYIRSKTGGKFSRWFFYNILKGKIVFIKFSTILYVLDYLECSYNDIDTLIVPDSFRRKYIK
jgi:hypothetical protein